MAQLFGLGNFVYELTVSDGKANFAFRDPDDAANTAEVTINQSDFPEGVTADSRQVADLAFDQCQRVLNDKRDARIKKEAAAATDAQVKEEARARQEAQDFHSNAQDVAVRPASVDKDGTTVYNTAPAEDTTPQNDNKKK